MKRILSAFLSLLLLFAPALAEELPLVVDDAGLLSREQLDELARTAEELSERYGMDMIVLTKDSIGKEAAVDYALDWYHAGGYGQGADHDGVALIIAIEERGLAIVINGGANEAFTDDDLDRMLTDIEPYFRLSNFAGGIAEFLNNAEAVLAQADGAAVIGGADAPVGMIVSDAGGRAGALACLSLLMLCDALWTLQTGVNGS